MTGFPKRKFLADCGLTRMHFMVAISFAAVLAVTAPALVTHHRRSQTVRVRHDLETLDAAVQRYALQTDRDGGFRASFPDLVKYLDPDSDVYRNHGKDCLGHDYGPFTVDARPQIPAKTAEVLSDAVPADFWSPYH